MNDMRKKVAKWLEEYRAKIMPGDMHPSQYWQHADELLALFDGEPVAEVEGIDGGTRRRGTIVVRWLVHSGGPIRVGDKLYLHAAPVEQHDPIGYVEEDDLPLTGRSTLHQEPNASRVAVYREPGEGPIKSWMTDPYLITRRNQEVAAAIAEHLGEE